MFFKDFLILFFEFFKVGLFAVGGGLATIPFLNELCDKYDWFTRADLSNMIAVSESTPGPIGVNMATYTGFTNGMSLGGTFFGVIGGITSTLGLITPSIIVIILVAKILEKFKNNKYVQDGFYGLRPGVVGLISAAVYGIFKTTLFCDYKTFDYRIWVLFLPLCFVSFKFPKIHPVVIILIGAIAGILLGGAV